MLATDHAWRTNEEEDALLLASHERQSIDERPPTADVDRFALVCLLLQHLSKSVTFARSRGLC